MTTNPVTLSAAKGLVTAGPGLAQIANLWKVLDVARAYESSGPATLRAVVRFLETETEAGREEGDSPVGEQAGAQVEVLTVHKAKGLEYPIVIVADLLSDRLPEPNVIVRHATGDGWLKIGGFEPAGWKAAETDEEKQQDAEERRLLYVALTRARDHVVIPCFPDKRRKAWLDDAIAGFALDGREPPYGRSAPTIARDGSRGKAEVTWFDSRDLEPVTDPTTRANVSTAIDGTDADFRRALMAEETWEATRKTRRAAARKVAQVVAAATDIVSATEPAADAEEETVAPSEAAAELADTGPDVGRALPESHSEAFGRLVHALLALPDAATADLAVSARALAPQFGLTESEAASAADLATRARTLPEIAAAQSADLVYRELPFAVPIAGKLTTGRIDLAYRNDSGWTVIDFKTASFTDPMQALAVYGPQVKAYREALTRITGAAARSALCLLGNGRLLQLATRHPERSQGPGDEPGRRRPADASHGSR